MSITRREWLSGVWGSIGALSCGSLAGSSSDPSESKKQDSIKPITGSWISIQFNDKRHMYWNNVTAHYTDEQWQAALDGKTFYDSKLGPKWKIRVDDPIGVLLDAGDRYGVKFFISVEFLTGWHGFDKLNDKGISCKRLEIMNEVAEKYAHHKSFYGWYLATEGVVSPDGFPAAAVEYINTTADESRKITPKARTLFAPYYTYLAAEIDVDRYAKGLEKCDIDIIAYQDEVGCQRMNTEVSARAFAKLREVHDKVQRPKLWADVEAFDWEGPGINVKDSPLVPAPWSRLKKQLGAVSPFVDEIAIYQYQGLLSQPYTFAPAGRSDATTLYIDYVKWLSKVHPESVKADARQAMSRMHL